VEKIFWLSDIFKNFYDFLIKEFLDAFFDKGRKGFPKLARNFCHVGRFSRQSATLETIIFQFSFFKTIPKLSRKNSCNFQIFGFVSKPSKVDMKFCIWWEMWSWKISSLLNFMKMKKESEKKSWKYWFFVIFSFGTTLEWMSKVWSITSPNFSNEFDQFMIQVSPVSLSNLQSNLSWKKFYERMDEILDSNKVPVFSRTIFY